MAYVTFAQVHLEALHLTSLFSFKIYDYLTQKLQLNNADVVKKFIFRYLNGPLTDDVWNILMIKTNRDNF